MEEVRLSISTGYFDRKRMRGRQIVGAVRKGWWLARGQVMEMGPAKSSLREPSEAILGSYCLDLRPALLSGHFDAFDIKGIPTREYDGWGSVHNWSRVAGYAIACFQRLGESHSAEWKVRFETQANHLLASAVELPTGTIVWPAQFGWLSLEPGWISALYQGQAMSVLLRAYLLTGEVGYRRAAEQAWDVFNIPVAQGGLRTTFPATDDPCWEEYPTTNPSHVLNGWLAAIWGLGDLNAVTAMSRAQETYEEAISSLSKHLASYDTGWWSTYDRPDSGPPRLASLTYHYEHIWMLDALARRTGRGDFRDWSIKWGDYAASPANRLKTLCLKAGQELRPRA